MEIPVKRPERLVPEYSLTGDLLAFSQCARQYRYYNGSSLPPSRPVQMWYGEFIHGVLESAFRLWSEQPALQEFPWPLTPIADDERPREPAAALAANDIRVIGWPVEAALAQQGKQARSRRARRAAYRRAQAAINMLGPHLFPLIEGAEQRVVGTRFIPRVDTMPEPRSERYGLQGVIDVLTHVRLAEASDGNIVREAVAAACPDLRGPFEVIVDYKGAQRPQIGSTYWRLGEWQVRTYGWLRGQQHGALPVAAGILIYVNELAPGQAELAEIKKAMRGRAEEGGSDITPVRGSRDYYLMEAWEPGRYVTLSPEFRLRRAIRVVPMHAGLIDEATSAFDMMVSEIEMRVMEEARTGSIQQAWEPNCDREGTCAACDFRYSCSRPVDMGWRLQQPDPFEDVVPEEE